MTEPAANLPPGTELPFAELQSIHDGSGAPERVRALMFTLVAIGPEARLASAAATLEQLAPLESLRAILIAPGAGTADPVRLQNGTILLRGVPERFVDNAVAALRLSSLPTVVWWRGGSPAMLEAVAALADRVVLDEDDPEAVWRRVPDLAERTAFSDLRWTRLTPWRALTAHFFDLPEILAAVPELRQLKASGADRAALSLFAGWLESSLQWDSSGRIDLSATPRRQPIEHVLLTGGGHELELSISPSRTCLTSAVSVNGRARVTRTVSLGDQSDAGLLRDELRIRARDAAFERAVEAHLKRT